MFGPSGGQEALVNNWQQPRTWQRPGPWRRFTFFELVNKKEKVHGSAEVSETQGFSTGSAKFPIECPQFPVMIIATSLSMRTRTNVEKS